jgi:hypothetical protein
MEVERQFTHPGLGRLVGVDEPPLDRLLAEFTVVRGNVGAAAVVVVTGDGVVIVSVGGGDRPLGDQRDYLVGMRAVAGEITSAVDALDPELVDPRQRRVQRRNVAVDIGDDRDGPVYSSRHRRRTADPGLAAHRRLYSRRASAETSGLRARMIAEVACSWTLWVSWISTSVNPAACRPERNSSSVRAPAMQPV